MRPDVALLADHERRGRVAERLVALATERQVLREDHIRWLTPLEP
jgi:hypothetical protein